MPVGPAGGCSPEKIGLTLADGPFFDGFVPVFRKERSMVTVAVALTSELVLPSPDQRPSQR
jgi:hypothetical protein